MPDLIDILAPIEQEGTKAVVRNWLKQIGDNVVEGDALVELETDKVTQEVPAPCDGILTEINLTSGVDATPGSVLGRLTSGVASVMPTAAASSPVVVDKDEGATTNKHYSPAVRRAASEFGIDPSTVSGSGKGGRVTRADMELVNERKLKQPEAAVAVPLATFSPVQASPTARTASSVTELETGSSRKVPHSSMRLAIAKHMSHSLSTAPQVTAVFEADFTAIMRHRDVNKARMKSEGVNLSYTAYIVAASVAAMKVVPEVNSQWHDESLEVFGDVNIGVGTALGDKGLVVPVIRQTQHLSLQGIAASLQEMTNKARSNTLKGDDLKGGTFTISNHGVSGSLLAAPIIINQPQSAILGVGKLEKRVIVREVDGVDTIQIRPMAYVSLTIDHRSLDGHQTNTWLTEFVRTLETWS
ncbi:MULTISPECIES: dihydrolipoamide acetyltransferase family protein [Rhizobium/Agrobacterium group]|uniref:dihydrolipoamide acetyltransferase family protein n=1 Tax=Rhizobium/Agrobacterium group TaxID=227290 RepID=UPI00107F656E|nr:MULTISPECIES: 2-oxo acid dehydrogenase subunit E2 [Rhizobium/Agrobacterium group]MBB4403152.1 2-oxoglutarate dehydrogenase E2 component (dihydrolipoamide succinyltransferase) [Agrobacterium radiobacter]MBB5588938.1 2-oxoglutarate dehydrogenase E2 component (dihydrolipoamide succinyltransferase) [Agrobacterium radiobacter]TGE86530.1 dihydrolipoamide succinyltransferase [Rhizobium sp. SEMIA 4032]